MGQRGAGSGSDAPRSAGLHSEAVGQRATRRDSQNADRTGARRCAKASVSKPRTALLRAAGLPQLIAESAVDAPGARDDLPRRPFGRQRSHHRRKRDRQRSGRADAAFRLGARHAAAASRSTPAGSPKAYSKASCSATSKARSLTPRPTESAASKWPTAATLFLDEIANIPQPAVEAAARHRDRRDSSAWVLRRRASVNVRIFSATNADLNAEVAERTFSRRTCSFG